MNVLLLYNEPLLPPHHADYASEAGVLESVEAFAAVLTPCGHNVRRVAVRDSIATLVADLSHGRPDVVVNFCEGFAGQSGGEVYVAGLLELLGVPYTGCTPECLALVHDKPRAKLLFQGTGIPTPRFWVIGEALQHDGWLTELHEQLQRGPLFVKPAAEDASLGIGHDSVVTDAEALQTKVAELQSRYGAVLVEQYVPGREFNVGIVALPEPQVLPLAEIAFQTGPAFPFPIVTYQSKWESASADDRATPVECPAELDKTLRRRIEAIALRAYEITGCRDYARVDLRVAPNGDVFVLEVNANPDASPHAGLARAIGAAGIDYQQFAQRLVATAANRRHSPGLRRGVSTSGSPGLRPGVGLGVRLQSSEQRIHDPPSPVEAQLNSQGRKPLDQPAKNVASPGGAARPPANPILIRHLTDDDVPLLVDIVRACRMFRNDEIAVAHEVLQEAGRDADSSHYHVLVAESSGRAVGWSCHGRVPMTDATYDLYWIVVHPDAQRCGVGRALLEAVESQLRGQGARWLLAETSSTAAYEKTREFYLRCGFTVVGVVPDFYRKLDGRITFGKRLDQ